MPGENPVRMRWLVPSVGRKGRILDFRCAMQLGQLYIAADFRLAAFLKSSDWVHPYVNNDEVRYREGSHSL